MNITRRTLLVASTASLLARPTFAAPPQQPLRWRKLNTEPSKGKQDDIFFLDAKTGWYGNGKGKLFATVDGGESWTVIWEKPGTFIRALGFVNAKTGFMGNVGTDYFPGVTDANPLYKTVDGGRTWQVVELPKGATVRGICGISIVKSRTIISGALIQRTLIHAAGRVGGPAGLLRSLDGGNTWTHIDLSAQAGMILDVKFFDPMSGLIAASTSSDIAQGRALILRTNDGGRTWIEAYKGIRKLENCWKMAFPSRDVGYASVQSYGEDPKAAQRYVIKTIDGGKSWVEIPLVKDLKAREFGIGFASETLGWVGCAETGYETRDGGLSWSPVDFGRAVNKIRVISGPRGFTAYAIGVDVHKLDGTVA